MTDALPTSSAALAALVERIEAWTGIELNRGGRRVSLARFLEARVRALGLRSGDAYVDGLTGPDDPEVERIVGVVTVGHTWFFRDAGQMQTISSLLNDGLGDQRTVQVWVPGCSTGEDAYTIALLAARARREIVVVGTDINSHAIDHARRGRFGSWSIRELPPELRGTIVAHPGDLFEVAPDVRRRVHFHRHNILEDAPAPPDARGWDVILCRNVLIYFAAPTASRTLARLSAALAPGGWLLVGASEVVHAPPPGALLRPLGGRFGLQRERAAAPEPRGPSREPIAVPASAPVRPVSVGSSTPSQQSVSAQRAEREHLSRDAPKPPIGASGVPIDERLARAGACLSSGDTEMAVKLYRAVLELDPLCAEARLFAGIAHHLRGDPASAVEELRAALFLDPDLWPAAFYLALNYEKLGLTRDAQREYQRVVSMSDRIPTLRSAGSVLGDIAAWKAEVVAIAKRRARGSVGVAEGG